MPTGKNRGDKKEVGSDWGKFVVSVLAYLVVIVILIGMILYLIAQYKKDIFQPFEMATVVGLVGGFIFVAAFGEPNKTFSRRLKRIGTLYLLSTITLVVFGFYQAADQAKLAPAGGLTSGWITTFYVLTFYLGAGLFCVAILLTLTVIPQLVGIDNLGDVARRIFGGQPKGKE